MIEVVIEIVVNDIYNVGVSGPGGYMPLGSFVNDPTGAEYHASELARVLGVEVKTQDKR